MGGRVGSEETIKSKKKKRHECRRGICCRLRIRVGKKEKNPF